MIEKKRCYGCGAIIQNEDSKQAGYVPASVLNNEKIICQRCFKIKNYHQLVKSNLSKDDFLSIMQGIAEKDSLIIYLIDIFDFNGSMISGIQRHLLNNDIIVVANKRDVLPKSIKDTKIKDWIKGQLKEYGLQPLDIVLISAKKNYYLDDLMDVIQTYRKDRDVYVVGVTNVGKSSLINALLKHYTEDSSDFLITTSEFPGTTLDLIRIPFDKSNSLYDTPGIINEFQMAHYIDEKELKIITPNSELRPKTFQLQPRQTVYFGGLARMDFESGENSSFICYFPPLLEIHRTKLENADTLYNRGFTLKPTIASIETIEDMATHTFTLNNDKKTDIVISGLGWVSVHAKQQKITIKAPIGVGVMLRKALI